MAEQPKITFDKPKALKLKARYKQAVANGESEFTFEGHVLLTSYARYLVQYLAGNLGFDPE